MIVELKKLQPNPMRDFTIDPIEEDRVKELAASIKEDGCWGGVVCRRTENNGIQIAAGHHRVTAAIKAGIREAEIFAGYMDDAAMIRIYARENALQRGNTSTALAGSVAAAVRFLAKVDLTAETSPESNIRALERLLADIRSGEITRTESLETVLGNLISDKGVGRPLILRLLEDTPGINDNTVKQQLANLKASGDYARIIREVQQQIEKENQEAFKALKRAEEEVRRAEEERIKAEAARKEAEELR